MDDSALLVLLQRDFLHSLFFSSSCLFSFSRLPSRFSSRRLFYKLPARLHVQLYVRVRPLSLGAEGAVPLANEDFSTSFSSSVSASSGLRALLLSVSC